MKLLDANILLYAYNSDSPHHHICREWLEEAFNGAETVGLPWQTVQAFIRIATHSRATERPLTAAQACVIVEMWLGHPNVMVVNPAERFWSLFSEQLLEGRVRGPLVTDASLATLAIESGAVLCSTDRDFRRFSGLRVLDPLDS